MGSVSWRQQTCQHLSVAQSRLSPPHSPDMKLQTQENLRLQNEIRKLEAILPAVDSSQKENVDVDEILSLTISYIGLLHNQLVGRVRTHGETYLRSKLGNNPGGINEKSSKDEIIKYLHRMLQK